MSISESAYLHAKPTSWAVLDSTPTFPLPTRDVACRGRGDFAVCLGVSSAGPSHRLVEAVRDVTPYQTTCDPPGLHRMTRDSDEPSKPSNILGRQARYPTQADRGGMSRNPNLAPGRGPDGSGKLRTSRDQMRNHRLPLVSVGLVSTWSRGRVGPEVHSSKGHSTSPDNHTPGWRLGYGPTRPGTRSQTQPQGVHFIPAELPATTTPTPGGHGSNHSA